MRPDGERNANWLTVHLRAAFAEHEREQISKRTKDALRRLSLAASGLGEMDRIGLRRAIARRRRKPRSAMLASLSSSA
jgi:hypothetical protein